MKLSIGSTSNVWYNALSVLVAAVLLAYGLWSFPLAILGEDRAMIPGDLGDARFNNYVLEHFHQYATGSVESYWDAPFMYPYKNTIALSDNLLGTAPLYSLFRCLGYNTASAFQSWIIALFALNFLCAFVVLWRWSERPLLAGAGAFIFAFGIHMIGQLEHAQVFPKFMVPIAFWFCWKWITQGRSRDLLLTSLAVVYQFYCGIYLGFMLCYALLFLVLAYALVERKALWARRPANWKPYILAGGIAVLAVLLLLPLMVPYLKVSTSLGMRTFEEVKATIPRPVSYFFTHPAALSWQNLSGHSQFAFDEWWSHFHFMGAIPWLAIILLPILVWRSDAGSPEQKELLTLGVAFALSTLFCLRIGDHTLYSIVFQLPGFSAMRAIDRIINVHAMYFALITTMTLAQLGRKGWQQVGLGLGVLAIVLLENKVDVSELKRFDKYAARAMVDRVVLDIRAQWDPSASAYAYAPARSIMPFEEDHQRTINMHLTAMLAGQELGVPMVNSYTGSYPGNYIKFWDRLDQRTLDDWCGLNNITSGGIRFVNNIHRPIHHTDSLHLRTPGGAYLSVDTDREDLAFADRAKPLRWETFVELDLGDGRVAFVAHNGNFLSAALHSDSGLIATSDRLGDMGIFQKMTLDSNVIALIADNGKYMVLDPVTDRLFAKAETIAQGTRFNVERYTP